MALLVFERHPQNLADLLDDRIGLFSGGFLRVAQG